MELRRSAHAVYKTEYHIVWVTKYRKKILNRGVSEYVKLKLREVQKYYPDLKYLSVGTDEDHIHLHMVIPPRYSVARVVGLLKSNTGRELREKFEFLREVYWGVGSVWSNGYFVSTVGINDEVIRKYVAMQGREDAGQAKLEVG
jgi:putative transposase